MACVRPWCLFKSDLYMSDLNKHHERTPAIYVNSSVDPPPPPLPSPANVGTYLEVHLFLNAPPSPLWHPPPLPYLCYINALPSPIGWTTYLPKKYTLFLNAPPSSLWHPPPLPYLCHINPLHHRLPLPSLVGWTTSLPKKYTLFLNAPPSPLRHPTPLLYLLYVLRASGPV